MTPREIFQRYRSERRGQIYAGFKLEVLPHLSRYVAQTEGATGFVMFAQLKSEDITTAIDEQVAYFRHLGQDFEWKVHDFDTPKTLRQDLEQRGFRQSDQEAFLVLDAARWIPPSRQTTDVRIERITNPQQLTGFVAAEEAIWPGDSSGHVQNYAQELATAPNAISIYCAYKDDTAVATGRVTFPVESSFAQLNGGGVLPGMRGQGIFSAMLSRRIEEAKARGYTRIAVDAAPMSRPILLRKGFQHVCWTYPMLRRF